MESSDHKDIPSTSGNADLAGLLAQVDSQVGCFHSAEKLNNDSAAFFFFGVFSNPAPPFPVSAALLFGSYSTAEDDGAACGQNVIR